MRQPPSAGPRTVLWIAMMPARPRSASLKKQTSSYSADRLRLNDRLIIVRAVLSCGAAFVGGLGEGFAIQARRRLGVEGERLRVDRGEQGLLDGRRSTMGSQPRARCGGDGIEA